MRDVYEMVLLREGHPVPLFVSICTMQVHWIKTGQMEWKDNGKLALATSEGGPGAVQSCIQTGRVNK